MITIAYENVVFRINDLSLLLEKLYYYLNQPKNVKELFDPNIFKFVVIDLLKEKKGIKTFCKLCDMEFYPDQIKVEKIGTYPETQPIKEKRNVCKRIKNHFERKKLEMRMQKIWKLKEDQS